MVAEDLAAVAAAAVRDVRVDGVLTAPSGVQFPPLTADWDELAAWLEQAYARRAERRRG